MPKNGERLMSKDKREFICDNISSDIINIAEKIATEEGAHTVTVSKIIRELNVTNRVFYNRFANIDEVLRIIYENAVVKMRKAFVPDYDKAIDADSIYDYAMDVAENVLVATYEVKMKFIHYMFEHDSLTENNRIWWMNALNKAIEYAKGRKLIKDIDTESLSYSVWCFCRGFNADAVSRKISKEDAVKYFRVGFGCFLNGIRYNDG